MWSISFENDPLDVSSISSSVEVVGNEQKVQKEQKEDTIDLRTCESVIVKSTSNIKDLISSLSSDHNNDNNEKVLAFEEGGRVARTTLAYLFSHAIADSCPHTSMNINMSSKNVNHHNTGNNNKDGDCDSDSASSYVIEPLYFMRRWKKIQQFLRSRNRNNNSSNAAESENTSTSTSVVNKYQKPSSSSSSSLSSSRRKPSSLLSPYIMERTDVWCNETTIHITLAVIIDHKVYSYDDKESTSMNTNTDTGNAKLRDFVMKYLQKISSVVINGNNDDDDNDGDGDDNCFLSHIANTVLQTKLRTMLPSLDAVAFIANGSIMPRKSGASLAPMSSPPAIPFIAPNNSTGSSNLAKQVSVKMGKLAKYVKNQNVSYKSNSNNNNNNKDDEISIMGMVIPKGITLIVGGGYHGKSTMLRTIMAGVYNKNLGDGRELCVTDISAVTVRAEDGRYVNNTNVSAFISNLPIVGSDTKHFSSREASGSTSQAANVADAIEMNASAILVDEDVSAANFMSRDGRMRALVMDESITPLLYRVNGLFDKHGISSVVVVGGVGDWLDVPNTVIRLEKYVASDALEKAKSISRQFSHGHVLYGGRGVVHRLEWDSKGTPFRRRPLNADSLIDLNKVRISLLDGGGKLSLTQWSKESDIEKSLSLFGYDDCFDMNLDDEDVGTIDMTRCEQLLQGKHQLYGCGICVIWILKAATENPSLDLNQLLDKLEVELDGSTSFGGILKSLSPSGQVSNMLLTALGYATRPRRYEIMMALSRMRGIKFEDLPPDNDIAAEIEAKEREEEEKKRILAELWANRRKKK